MDDEKYCLGIDFGTTNSKMAYWFLEHPTVIHDDVGDVNIPSVVHFTDDGHVLVGKEAKENMIPFPERTISSVKRKMGSHFRYEIDGENYPPEYIGALIFRQLLTIAKSQTNIDFTEAVVSVPANFTDGQRYAIKDAAEIAGLNINRMINEPTAAALAYGLKADKGEKKTLLIYDFGGGTFDVSILTISDNFFNVEASGGINKCGGDDIDERIMNYLGAILKKQCGFDVTKDLKAKQVLRDASETAKIELSSAISTFINIPFLTTDAKLGPIAFSYELTRATLDSLIKDLIESTRQPVMDVLQSAGLTIADLDEVILAGGTTKIPAIQAFVEELTGKPPLCSLDPHEVVAIGAAITSQEGNMFEIDMNASPIEISDVVSHSFGVRVYPENVIRIIEKNDKLPVQRSKVLSNFCDYTPELSVEVYEGEKETISNENFLGSFLIDVTPMPMGCNRLDVTYEIGIEYGILVVTAKDLDTGLERKVRMEAKSRLSNQEKLKWAQMITNGGTISVVVNDEERKLETSLFINSNRTIYNVLERLQQRNFIGKTENEHYMLYFKKQELEGQKHIADITKEALVTFELQKTK